MAEALRVNGLRQDTWAVGIILNGKKMGIWDKKTGGELDSEESKYYPGAMELPVSLGGRVTPGNVTCQRLYDKVADTEEMALWFKNVGKGTVQITQRPMDIDGHRYGKAVIWFGTLKRVSMPDVDSESNSAALLEIEITVATPPHVAGVT